MKAIYVAIEDSREMSLLNHGFGCKVFLSKGEACTFCIKRMWYNEPEFRVEIAEYRKQHGDIKAYSHFNTGWIYAPTIYKRMVEVYPPPSPRASSPKLALI